MYTYNDCRPLRVQNILNIVIAYQNVRFYSIEIESLCDTNTNITNKCLIKPFVTSKSIAFFKSIQIGKM